MTIRNYKSLLCTISIFASTSSLADPASDLAKKAENPIETMISIPFDNDFNFNYGDKNKTQYILNLKPVVPFSINTDWNLIIRTIAPIISQPNLKSSHGYINGLGDVYPSFFFSPANPGKIIWGFGPAIFFPTATNAQLGSGKYSIGPTLAVLITPGNWVTGFLTYNVWSIAGDPNRPNVNSFEFQYFINYNFSHGWYLTTSPTLTADWTTNSSDRWVVPVGIGIGKVFKIGKQDINASIQAYDNVITPVSTGPDWQFELNITLLFPENRI